MANKKNETAEITVVQLQQGQVTFCVLGTSPLIYNAMSEKVRQDLLCPPPKKNAIERATTFKHEPLKEYRNSVYRTRSPDAPTALAFPAAAFKKALASTALDIPGAARTEIARLVWATGDAVEVYGTPQLLCSVVRSSDINRTPDIRTRAILPEWACKVTFTFTRPNLKDQTIANLFAAAGMIRGVGDWRQEKGSGNYGQFTLVGADDPTWTRIVADQQRAQQQAALDEPGYYDSESASLIEWFTAEKARREGTSSQPSTANGKPAKRGKVTTAEA